MPEVRAERRQYERVNVTLPATVQRLGNRPVATSASTVDLSEGGACLATPDQFVVGDVVLLSIGPGELAVQHQGLIVGHKSRAGDTAILNIAFKTPSEQELARLQQLIDLR